MADRYFDLTPAANGFGTLTGAWNTATANWTASNTGASGTNVAYTFTNADAAFFGSTAVASTTAGTATIAAALNVNINSIRTANLPARQTIAANAGGKLTMGGASPSFDTAGAGGLTVSAPIEGTAGFTKTGAGDLQLTGANAMTGTLTASVGSLVVGSYNSGTPNNIDSVTSLVCNSGTFFWGANAYTFGKPFSGLGTIGTNNPNTVTLSDDASVSAFTGTFNPTCDDTVNGRLRLNAFPSSAGALLPQVFSTGATARTATIALYHASPSSTSAIVYLYAANTSTGGVSVLEDNGTASSTYNGIVTNLAGSNAGATLRLRLQGTNTNATYAGQIQATNASGKLGLTKDGTGKWILSGENLYDGNNLISGGTLSAQSEKALGSATSAGGVSVTGTGKLELAGNITLNKSSTAFSIHTNNPITSVGDNTLRTAGVTLNGTTTFQVTDANRLTIDNSSAISGNTFGIIKTGAGELVLNPVSNAYTGAVLVDEGTLTVGSVANSGSPAAWGQGTSVSVTGILNYNGTGHSSNRSVTLAGTSPTIKASGAGPLTLSNITQTSVAKTINLSGASTASNTISSAVTDTSFATSVAKSENGRWELSGALSYTGTTTVSAGVLRVTSTNSNTTSGTVTVDSGAEMELITSTSPAGSGNGRVLGSSNVVVNGKIKTGYSTTQRGQIRFGGNVTFGAGSELNIGAVAA